MTHSHYRQARRFLVLFVLLGSGACSSSPKDGRKPVYPVKGKVLFKDQPAVGAYVVFVPASEPADNPDPRPRATVQADGTFQLFTYEVDDGAPAGSYTVIVTWPSENRDEPEDKFFGRYADPTRSNIKYTIQAGPNELDPIRLK